MAKRPSRETGDFSHPAMNYKAPKELQRFRYGMALIVGTLAVLGVWTGVWFVAQHFVNKTVSDWFDAQRANGAKASYASLDVSGYPFHIVLDLKAPQYKGPMMGELVAWQGEAMTLRARPWSPSTLHIEAPGKHTVTLKDKALAYTGTVQALQIDLTPGDGWPENLDIGVEGMQLQNTTTKAPMGAAKLRLHAANDVKSGVLVIGIVGEAVNLPKTMNLALGNVVQSVDVQLSIKDPPAAKDLTQNIAQILPAWQQRGNAIDVQTLSLHHGPLVVSTAGTLSLDDALQPTAAFIAKIEGLFQVLEIFRTHGLVTPSNAAIATMALSALSKRPNDGSPAYINLSVTIDDGQLKLGPVPILEMPKFTWGIVAPEELAEESVPPPRDYKDVAPVF